MKKLLSLFLCGLFFCTCFIFPVSAEESGEEAAPDTGVTINVYNWGEYISDGSDGTLNVNQEFTRRTGIHVNYTTFDTNESLYSKLVSGGASYDVIFPSELYGCPYDQRGNA